MISIYVFYLQTGPNILRNKTKKRDIKEETQELIDLEEPASKNIEFYIKQEDIKENEFERIKAQLLEANLLKENSDETLEKYEEIDKLVIKNNLLMQNFDKLYEENENMKRIFIDLENKLETFTKENKILKEQLDKTSSLSENGKSFKSIM